MRISVYLVLFAALEPRLFGLPASDELTAHSTAAQNAQKIGDFPKAIREYEILAHLLPQNAEVLSNLGIAQYFNNNSSQAIATFRKAIAIKPYLVTPHLFAGLTYYRLSDPDAAVAELEKAVKLNGSDTVARTWLGYSYTEQSRSELASHQFQVASTLDPNNIDVWYALGQSSLQLGKSATAKLLAFAPDGGRAWQLAGEQFQLQNDRPHARSLFVGALERRPDLVELRSTIHELGGTANVKSMGASFGSRDEEDRLYRLAHGYEQTARESFDRVLKLAPDSYRAHQVLADSYAAQHRSDDAIAEYQRVLQLKPDLHGIHEALGNIFLSVGKGSEALSEFQFELRIQPGSSNTHMNIARAMLVLGDNEGARKMLNQALDLNRPPVEVYKLLGKIELHRREYQAAIATFEMYVTKQDDDPGAYYLLAQAYRSIGDQQAVRRTLGLYQAKSKIERSRASALNILKDAGIESTDDSSEKNQASGAPPVR